MNFCNDSFRRLSKSEMWAPRSLEDFRIPGKTNNMMKLLVFLLAARGTTAYSLPGVSHCRGAAHALSRASSPSMKEVVGNYGFASDDEFRHGNGERRSPSQFGLAPSPTIAPYNIYKITLHYVTLPQT